MPDTPESLILITLARVTLLTQLMRIILRERAAINDHSPEDVLKWGEEIKQFFEKGTDLGLAEGYLTAAVDQFFNALASEVKLDRENR
jgi:hypothetical protein